jgi:uncharacterized protein
MKPRIPSLDLIRGFALFGVLAVNAAYFAAPLPSVVNPAFGPLAVTPMTAWSWFIPYVFLEYKSMALFSMLFGASLYLVGGDRSDRERSQILHRRLGWLILIGLVHGVLVWFGDILLLYALTGFSIMAARSWRPRTLLVVGGLLFAVSMVMIGGLALLITTMTPQAQATYVATSWAPPGDQLVRLIAIYHRGLGIVQLANLAAWIEFQSQALIFLGLRTAGLMMIGMGLFKSGFLSGAARMRTYGVWVAAGAVALLVLAWNATDIADGGFDMVRIQSLGTLVTAGLAPVVAIAYAAALILVLRSGAVSWLMSALASTGRMAFTNYLTQSIVMSAIFYGARGLGLYGGVSRPLVMAIAAALFIGQMIASTLWLRRHDHGPFEKVWRQLSLAGPHAGRPRQHPPSTERQGRNTHDSTSLDIGAR